MAGEGVLRPGFVELFVLDMDAAITHYVDYLGLDMVGKEADGRVYLKAYDEFDHHSVILHPADHAGVARVGFKVSSEAALKAYEGRILEFGAAVDHVPAGEQPGLGRRISFLIPSGHRIELYAEAALAENHPPTKNPGLWHVEPHGMRAMRFDHVLLYGPEIPEVLRFFTTVLDFKLAEQVVAPDGPVAIFLTTSNKAHDIAFVAHPEPGKFHHASFLLEDWSDVGRAADLMTHYDIPLDIGPTRHGITRGKTIYFFDPSGNRNEVFAGDYTFYPDSPVRTWDADKIGKAIFYYDRALNERFLSVLT